MTRNKQKLIIHEIIFDVYLNLCAITIYIAEIYIQNKTRYLFFAKKTQGESDILTPWVKVIG